MLTGNFTLLGVACPSAFAKIAVLSGNTDGWVAQFAVFSTRPADGALAPPAPTQQYAIPVAYVAGQDVIQDALDAALAHPDFSQMTREAPKSRLSPLEFMDRFSDGENDRIHSTNDANVVRALRKFAVATYIDLTRADTQGYVNYLQSLTGMLDAPSAGFATRAAQILTP